jgi:hypothetical protein
MVGHCPRAIRFKKIYRGCGGIPVHGFDINHAFAGVEGGAAKEFFRRWRLAGCCGQIADCAFSTTGRQSAKLSDQPFMLT